jgi:histidinol-phosphate aminotransferase
MMSAEYGTYDVCELAPGYIRAIAPYQPGKPIAELAREFGLNPDSIIKLASNENPLGTSPLAMQAIHSALADTARYPDGNGFELKQALSARYGIAAAQCVLGNGSNDVLELAARSFLAPGAEAIYSQHAFAVYPLAVQAVGATGVEVPAREFAHDLDAMLKAVSSRTRMVFLANPNNPTGTLILAPRLLEFLRAIAPRVMVVLDEAYNEYLPDDLRTDTVAWLREFPNLIITRTFSKIYGLAGLRVGYALARADVADLMNRVRQPFNVNSFALTAAAAALGDVDFVRTQSAGYAASHAGIAAPRSGIYSIIRKFCQFQGGRRCRGVSATAATWRDCTTCRRLWHAAIPAGQHRT